jgi:hypothetical protein
VRGSGAGGRATWGGGERAGSTIAAKVGVSGLGQQNGSKACGCVPGVGRWCCNVSLAYCFTPIKTKPAIPCCVM